MDNCYRCLGNHRDFFSFHAKHTHINSDRVRILSYCVGGEIKFFKNNQCIAGLRNFAFGIYVKYLYIFLSFYLHFFLFDRNGTAANLNQVRLYKQGRYPGILD